MKLSACYIIGKNEDWYHISFKHNGKNLNGYVSAKYVKVQMENVCTGVNAKVNASVKFRKKPVVSSDAVKVSGKSVSLKKGTNVVIHGEKNSEKKR